jgi:hypothetical protein
MTLPSNAGFRGIDRGAMSDLPAIELELLGAARLLARREAVHIVAAAPLPLHEFCRRLADELPALVGTVMDESGALLGGHAFSRDGADLIRRSDEVIRPGDRLLLLSTAAGG